MHQNDNAKSIISISGCDYDNGNLSHDLYAYWYPYRLKTCRLPLLYFLKFSTAVCYIPSVTPTHISAYPLDCHGVLALIPAYIGLEAGYTSGRLITSHSLSWHLKTATHAHIHTCKPPLRHVFACLRGDFFKKCFKTQEVEQVIYKLWGWWFDFLDAPVCMPMYLWGQSPHLFSSCIT